MQEVILLSDIHANRYALHACLDLVEREWPTAQILNLGDFVSIGPHPQEVASIVLDEPRFLNIIGNNEEALLDFSEVNPGEGRHRQWTAQRLGPDLLARIKELPKQRIVELERSKLLMHHARLESSVELPTIYRGSHIDDFVGEYLSEGVNIVTFGHTHDPFYLYRGGIHFINPGALGVSRSGKGSFCLLRLDGDRVSVSFREVSLNMEALMADLLRRNVPDKEFIVDRFFGVNSLGSL